MRQRRGTRQLRYVGKACSSFDSSWVLFYVRRAESPNALKLTDWLGDFICIGAYRRNLMGDVAPLNVCWKRRSTIEGQKGILNL